MVVKKSEYQKQFKACMMKKHQEVYLENLNLRHQRRDREFMHTPICWEELSEEEKESSSDCCEEGQSHVSKAEHSRKPEAQYQSLAEILSDSREKAELARKQKHAIAAVASTENVYKGQSDYSDVLRKTHFEEKPVKELDLINQISEKKDHPEKSCSINDLAEEENKKLNKKLAMTYVVRPAGDAGDRSDDTDTDPDACGGFRPQSKHTRHSALNKRIKIKRRRRNEEPSSQRHKGTMIVKNKAGLSDRSDQPTESSPELFAEPLPYVPRIRRPDRKASIPKPKPMPTSPSFPVKERPPFMAYGSGDKEDNLATHRTHNVRAPVDVYMTALRAKIRREEQQKKHKEREHRTHSSEDLIEKLSSAIMHDPEDWESEYRKQFHGYEPKDYKRAASAQAVIHRSLPVRAVHRGGCLLVHVD